MQLDPQSTTALSCVHLLLQEPPQKKQRENSEKEESLCPAKMTDFLMEK